MSPPRWPDRAYLLSIALVLLFPFHFYVDLSFGKVNLSYGDLVVALVGVLWAIGFLGQRRLPYYTVPIVAFFVVAVVSVGVAFVSAPPYFALDNSIVELAKLAGAVSWMIAVYVLGREAGTDRLKNAFVLLCLLAAGFAIVSLYAALVTGVRRPAGPFENPNIYANFLVLCTALALYARDAPWLAGRASRRLAPRAGLAYPRQPISRPSSRRSILFLLSTVPLFLLASLTTGSRGGLVTFCVFLAVVAVFVLKQRRLSPSAVVGLAVVVASLSIALLRRYPIVVDRILELEANETRFTMWRVSLEEFLTTPVLGIGYGQTRSYLVTELGLSRTMHNTFVSILTEVGAIGFLAFVLLTLIVLRDVLDVRDRSVVFVGAFFVAALVHGLFTNVENFRAFWLALGVIAVHSPRYLSLSSSRPTRQASTI